MWHRALASSELADGSARSVEVGGRRVALFRLGKQVHALVDGCIHRGGPLGEGHLEGEWVTCPWHAWEFNVKTGKCRTLKDAVQPVVPAKIENGDVFVDL